MRHVQFCDLDTDITGELHAEEDADSIRVWEEDGTLIVCLSPDDTDVWSDETGRLVGDFGSREEAIELAAHCVKHACCGRCGSPVECPDDTCPACGRAEDGGRP